MTEKVVLIGAGSAMFTKGLVTDMAQAGWEGEIALVDIDEQALAVAEGLTRKLVEARHSSLAVTAHLDRRAALAGATAVICTVGVGGRRAWEKDVQVPRQFGIYQPDIGPNGLHRVTQLLQERLSAVAVS